MLIREELKEEEANEVRISKHAMKDPKAREKEMKEAELRKKKFHNNAVGNLVNPTGKFDTNF